MNFSNLSDKELLEYKHRLEFDISKYDTIQLIRKVAMNSAYGSCGNKFFRWYDIRIAESITKTGQFIIRFLEKRINDHLNKLAKTEDVDYIIASDTDSLVMGMSAIVNRTIPEDKQKNINMVIDFMDKVCNESIQPIIKSACEDIKEYLNAPVQAIGMKREILADSAIWTTKKRYVMSVRDKENVRLNEPKLKIMGIEAIRSSTPTVCRDIIKDCLKTMLHGTEKELQTKIQEFKEQFKSQRPEDISSPRTVNGLEKYSGINSIYIKGSPIHVKGSLIYNQKIKELKLLNKYSPIRSGDKIKYVYLSEPNPINDSVIAFSDELPEEFQINEAIDYDTQFEKTFLEPLTLILDVIGWKAEKQNTLNDFFD